MKLPELDNCCIAVIGVGYVGLPLAIELARNRHCTSNKILKRKIIGFDIDKNKVSELSNGFDRTKEIKKNDLKILKSITFTSNKLKLLDADIFLVTVPTPVDLFNAPDLTALKSASKLIGEALKNRSQEKSYYSPIIIYESTVYPGATEEICIPILEKESNLVFNNPKFENAFFCGYSPERINPGDKINNITSTKKVTSGSNQIVAEWVDEFYNSIIKAGTYLASSIKIPEASKVIENTQRDINIALMNEIAIICKNLNINTYEVLEAAKTKWNFLPFKPGLVGGHCIGVDPYYLAYQSESLGHYPEIIISGRKVNSNMPNWIVDQIIKEMLKRKLSLINANVLILGFSYKPNTADFRNTGVAEIYKKLSEFNMNIKVVDPWIDKKEAFKAYKIEVEDNFEKFLDSKFTVIIGAVNHDNFKNISSEIFHSILIENGIIFDINNSLPSELSPLTI